MAVLSAIQNFARGEWDEMFAKYLGDCTITEKLLSETFGSNWEQQWGWAFPGLNAETEGDAADHGGAGARMGAGFRIGAGAATSAGAGAIDGDIAVAVAVAVAVSVAVAGDGAVGGKDGVDRQAKAHR